MVKLTETLKIEQFHESIEAELRRVLERVPSLQIQSVRYPEEAPDQAADLIISVDTGHESWLLMVEAKQRAEPRRVRSGILQLNELLSKQSATNRYGILASDFVSPESARLCNEAKVGYIDLAGNARLSFDQIFIELQAAGNLFRAKRELKSLFTPKAERVLRVMLTPPLHAWKVTDLADAAGVSLGHVSNVRKLLLDREWVVATDAGVRVNKPEELAAAWGTVYQPRERAKETLHTLLHGEALEDTTRSALVEAGRGEHAVLGSYSAAKWIAPYGRHATQFFYADAAGARILKRHLQAQPVSRGENVVILTPKEDDMFSGRIEPAPGIWCTGLIQTWLDLTGAGERGAEAADHLLQEKLLPAWKSAPS